MDRFLQELGGVPYLVNDGLHALARRQFSLEQILDVDAEEPFGLHLRRLRSRCGAADLEQALRGVLRGEECPTEESFYSLRSAGVLAGESKRNARFRCGLYRRYFERHLP